MKRLPPSCTMQVSARDLPGMMDNDPSLLYFGREIKKRHTVGSTVRVQMKFFAKVRRYLHRRCGNGTPFHGSRIFLCGSPFETRNCFGIAAPELTSRRGMKRQWH